MKSAKKVKIFVKEKAEIKEGDVVMVPYTIGKFTKAIVKEIKDQYVKVKFVEKKILEAMNSDTALFQLKNVRKLNTRFELNSQNDQIIPDQWVHYNKKKFPEWINTVFLPYRIKEEEEPSKTWEWRPYQKFVRDYLGMTSPYRGLLLYHGLGSGKCHRIDTPIMLSDGKIKKVQDINVGEELMGDDAHPRRVLSLASGKDKIYMIKNKDFEYGVNSEHILCLKNKNLKIKEKNDEYQIEYLDICDKRIKKYTSNNIEEIRQFQNRIEEEVLEIELNKYLELSQYAKNFLRGYRTRLDFLSRETLISPYEFGYSFEKDNQKNIPDEYKINSYENRVDFLKGLIASSNIKKCKKQNKIYIKEESKDDILFMIDSLGIERKIKEDNKYLEIDINDSKKYHKYKFEVEYVGEEEYYGFTISGNGRYLLKDFTVTHNTCTSIAVAENHKGARNILILLPASLRSNYIKALIEECGDKEYKTNRNKLNNKYHFVSYNASNTIDQLKKIPSLDDHVIIIDEIHNLVSMMVTKSKKGPEIYDMLMNAKNCKIVALSGTPVVNFPFEVAKLANILCGYIELNIFHVRSVKNSYNKSWNLDFLASKLELLESVNYVEVQGKNILVNLMVKSYDPSFSEIIGELLNVAEKEGVKMDFIQTKKYTLFPDEEDEFRNYFVEETPDGELLKNEELLKRRLLGLISYYRGGKPIYFPVVNPVHIINVPMSDYQFRAYEEIRTVEREKEKGSSFRKVMKGLANSKSKNSSKKKVNSLFRVFSREFSNFVFLNQLKDHLLKNLLNYLRIRRKKQMN